MAFEVHASAVASYSGNTDTTVDWTPGLVRQGSTLDTSDTLATLPGTATLAYTLSGTVGIYNDPDLGADTWSPVSGETASMSFTFSQDIPCTLPLPGEAPRTCSRTDFIDIYTANIIVDITLRLGIETSITLNSNGVVTIRHAEVAGGPAIADNTMTFVGTSPSFIADPIFVACTQPVGTDLTYALTNATYSSPNTSSDYAVFLNVLIEEPVLGTDLFDADITPTIPITDLDFGTLTTTAPDKVTVLGPVLPDASPPVIGSVGGPYSGNEGRRLLSLPPRPTTADRRFCAGTFPMVVRRSGPTSSTRSLTTASTADC